MTYYITIFDQIIKMNDCLGWIWNAELHKKDTQTCIEWNVLNKWKNEKRQIYTTDVILLFDNFLLILE